MGRRKKQTSGTLETASLKVDEINIDWKRLTGIPFDKIIPSEKDRIANNLKSLVLATQQLNKRVK